MSFRSLFPVLVAAWALKASVFASAPAFQVLFVDSAGAKEPELAREIWKQTVHKNSKVSFQWLRIGAPEGFSKKAPSTPAAPLTPAEAILPKWDPQGLEARRLRLEGVPRVILLNDQNQSIYQEAFMTTPRLRYLCRHPDEFVPVESRPRMKN